MSCGYCKPSHPLERVGSHLQTEPDGFYPAAFGGNRRASGDNPPGAPKISEADAMLSKSRLGKATPSLVCQECNGEGAVQFKCLHVLCRSCAKEHVHV